jgi:membrane fusion protein, multidrug efflux system
MKFTAAAAFAVLVVCSTVRGQETQGLVLPFKIVSVSSPVLQEVINSVLVEEGDTVKEGQPIVQLRAEKEELEVERTEKQIELYQFKATGSEALFKEKMGSKEKSLEDQAQLALSKILHRAAEVSLKEKTVRSPLAGIVVKKYKEAGESVDRVEKLIDIVNIDQVYVQFYLDPKLMTQLKIDQGVPVKFPVIGNAEFTSKISFIDPRIDAGSGLFRIKVLIENGDHKIKAGMRGTADFAKLGK